MLFASHNIFLCAFCNVPLSTNEIMGNEVVTAEIDIHS